MKRLKLVIEASSITEERVSGIGHSLVEIIKSLERHPDNSEKFEVCLAVPFDKVHMLDRWEFYKVKYIRIACPMRPLNLLWQFNILPPMDLFLGRGVYLFPNYKNWWVPFSKSITYIHDISFVLYPHFVVPKNQRFLEKWMPKWIKRSTLIAADSDSAAKEIIEEYNPPKDKVVVLHHGVNTEQFYPRPQREIDALKEKYKISGDYILFLGNIEPRKNIEKLISAYAQLPVELQKRYGLLLVGGLGWLNETIFAAIKRAQKAGLNVRRPEVFFTDEDLPALYSGATILAHPAIYEGFGLSLVQAMACGLPVLAGDNSSMKEVVGNAGLLVDESNVNAISGTMKRLLEDGALRRELSEKGLKQSKKFNWDDTVAKIVKLSQDMSK